MAFSSHFLIICALPICLCSTDGQTAVIQTQQTVMAAVGEDVHLSCQLMQSRDVLQVTWQKLSPDGEEKNFVGYRNFEQGVSEDFLGKVEFKVAGLQNCSIVIRKVMEQDEGCYLCLFNTFPDGSLTGRTCLQLYGLTAVIQTQQTVMAAVGEDVHLGCQLMESRDVLQVTWQKLSPEGKEKNFVGYRNLEQGVSEDFLGKVEFKAAGLQDGSIVIREVMEQDEGCYLCLFNTFPEGSLTGRTCLQLYGLTAVIQTQQTVMAAVGEDVHLSCQLMQSRDVLQVTWQKLSPDGEEKNFVGYRNFEQGVSEDFLGKVEFKVAGLQNCSIVIRKVMEQDEGCYLCLFNTFPEGSLTGRTCLQLYELHEPILQIRESNSTEETVVSCSATGRPAPTVTLNVPQQDLYFSHNSTVSVTNTNGTVTVTTTAVLSGFHGNNTQVGCAAQLLSVPEIQVFKTIPAVKQSSADGFNDESGSDQSQTAEIQTHQTVMAAVGEDVHLSCLLMQSRDVLQVKWQKLSPEGKEKNFVGYRNLEQGVSEDFLGKVEFKDAGLQNCSIVIREVMEQDEGCYLCLFNTFPDGSLTGRTCLQLYGLTAVIQTQQTVMAAVGEDVHLSCQLMQSRDVLQVTWQKLSPDGEEKNFVGYRNFEQGVSEDFLGKVEFKVAGLQNCSIVIRKVMEQDEGCYLCLFNTFPEGSLTGRTCLQLYELHEPILQIRESNSTEETVVSCSATGRPAPTVTLNVPQQDLYFSHNSTVSVTNTNGTVTVTTTAVLSGFHGNNTQVGCAAQLLSVPEIQVFKTIPAVKQSSADGFNDESGSDQSQTAEIQTHQTVMAAVGEDVHLSCLLMQSRDVLQVKWQKLSPEGKEKNFVGYRNLEQGVSEDFLGKVEFKDAGLQNCSIVIREVMEQDEGCYLCLFNTFPDGSLTGRTCLQLYGLTAVIQTQQTVMAAVGEDVHLSCQLMQSRDVLQVTWQKLSPEGKEKNFATYNEHFGQTVIPGFQGKVEFKVAGLQNCSIVIRKVMEQDEGCYLCLFNTFPDGSLTGRTCLQLYELHEPILQIRESNSTEETVVSCSATGRPAPTVTLNVPQQDLYFSQNSTVSVTNTNGTVTVTTTAVLSGFHGNNTQVGCAAQLLSVPEIQVFKTIPAVKQSSADGFNDESGSNKNFTLIVALITAVVVVCVAVVVTVVTVVIRKHKNRCKTSLMNL
ncbi:uncharacterized protein LOC121891921 isoform X3 [Thunnus maccoyii]|uniref:uncharacterized protein LOC121891921 isoform X3 n=1 Tax=Thunnus maccoyii TaxID=8240 RepID=UPI001C4B8B60|nr:uncharacterized protein LOC121891921 isoform X3 [Thunnus maccoyii]